MVNLISCDYEYTYCNYFGCRNIIYEHKSSAAVNHAAAGLMGGEYQHLGYLHMGGRTCCIEGHVGNVCSRERGNTFIYLVGTLVVSME